MIFLNNFIDDGLLASNQKKRGQLSRNYPTLKTVTFRLSIELLLRAG
jgi:hypothetical protein